MSSKIGETPVLVVGGGIVGSLVALELAHHGVSAVVVERTTSLSASSKVQFISGRSMELLRRLGLASSIRLRGVDATRSTDFMFTQGFDREPVLVWQQPSVENMRRRFAAVNDGTAPAEEYERVRGALLEDVVREAAAAHPLVDMRRGWTFSDVRLDRESATATVVEAATRTRHRIRARFVVGCDGARSAVRLCLGIPMEDRGGGRPYCSVDFTTPAALLPEHGRAYVTAPPGLALVRRNDADQWSSTMPVHADQHFGSNPVALLRQWMGADFKVDAVHGVAQWTDSLAVAATYRRGPVFLAGDAAHQFYPGCGFGTGTGIADAVDLGWKLAASIRGWGGPTLLASYEAERRPAALFNREMCARLLDTWRRFESLSAAGIAAEQLSGLLEQDVDLIDNLGVHFGYRYGGSAVICHEAGSGPPWHWRKISPTTWPGARAPAVRLADGTQLFDQLGAGFTLVDQTAGHFGRHLAQTARARGYPVTHLAVRDPAVRTSWERDLVLVRPDHHVVWRGDAPPHDWAAVLDRVAGRAGDHANA
ncbi:FAD-dependent oxidoreductase [Luedemannella helvata]|uniref:FAD-dependent oxidoreductase n=1 Tax=Luedemannella helvata TaxID=349315 RepID=A0ABN2JTE3_9ACTN